MTKLATESGAVQFPLVKHASEIGWTVVSDTDALSKRRGEGGLFFYEEFTAALMALNPGLVNEENAPSIIQKLESLPNSIQGNREILEWLRGNRTIYDPQEKRARNVRLIDFEDVKSNTFQVTYEWAYKNGAKKGNRADVVFLINGIPIALIENKNPKDRRAMEKASVQLERRFMVAALFPLQMPVLFHYSMAVLMSCSWRTR